ncbi:acyl dehydratase [Streptomyces sp. A7024]|uniref:Acyl dehydratase n=1 Tax=Streptomyces coryli TaxID=1128680 RepID=A0A6G4U5S2_9ACTN|nr:MaoC/PaaZ C-terminal domain-containing protein [Streptomyces coryli]NGN66551.1 acyl dehydratase [Streptomyces coryli]
MSGETLPELRIPVTRKLIVGGAIATRDYQDVHHDAVAAKERGSPDIFMNILTTNGLVGRYVAECLGPGTQVWAVKIRLGVPQYPDDELVFTGEFTPGDDGTGQVSVVGRNRLGAHVTGTVTVVLAEEARE